MTGTLAPPAGGGSAPTSPTARSIWRDGRMIVLFGLLFVAIATIGVLLGPEPADERFLDPDDTSLQGSKALAELLRARGVQVDRVDSPEAARALGGDRLLFVTDTVYIDPAELASIPGDRLIVDPYALEALAPWADLLSDGRARERSREPRCALPAATTAGSVHIGGFVFTAPRGGTACYPAGDGWTLVALPHATGTTTVLGSGTFMTNLRLAEDGNAALAINLLDTGKPVTWLVRPETPPPTVAGERGRSLYELMPPSIGWALLMAGVAVAVTAIWRGRRLGPVVVERLPVVVRAAETVEGRGRLYRARKARARAADSLRAGAIDRLTPRLGLGQGADSRTVVSAIATRTGEDPQRLGDALYGPPPADDDGLVALAGYVDHIERKVSEL